MSRKILFFDLDGTLLDFYGNCPPASVEALKAARENGHICAICSGRARYMLKPIPEITSLCDGIVGSTGALVTHGGKTLFECYMPLDVTLRAMQAVKEGGGIFIGQGEDELFFSEEDYHRCYDYFVATNRGQNAIGTILGSAHITDNIRDFAAAKKLVYFNANYSVEKFASMLGDICDVTASSFHHGSCDGEITLKGINKSLGMQKYLDAVGLRREDCIAFGDGPNDLDMLAYAGTGVAMGNAGELVKAAADMVTDSVDNDGVAKAMKKLGII